MYRAAILLATATTLLGGCDASPRSPDRIVRDSAGVRIVENHSPAWSAAERLVVAPDAALVIGTADGAPEQQLYGVEDALRLPDGQVVILNSRASELLFYSREGAHLRTVGKEGRGPGEFQSPRWLATMADTLVVFDPFQGNGRLSLFDLEGDFQRSERVEVTGIPYPSPDFILPDGTYLDQILEGSIPPADEGHVVYTRDIVRYGRTASTPDTLIRGAPAGERYRERFAAGMAQSAVPFSGEPTTAVGPDRIYLGDGSEMVIDAYGLGGAHLMSMRADTERRAVGEAEVERWIETTLARPVYQRNSDAAARARRWFQESPVPDEMPAHTEIRVDAESRLWVRRYAAPWEESNEWWVFDRAGVWLGVVPLPPKLEVFEIGSDYILGSTTDALGVEYVEVYELQEGTLGEDR